MRSVSTQILLRRVAADLWSWHEKNIPLLDLLLILLTSGMLKNNIMETTFKLQKVDKFKQIITSHKMTKIEQEQCKSLVAVKLEKHHIVFRIAHHRKEWKLWNWEYTGEAKNGALFKVYNSCIWWCIWQDNDTWTKKHCNTTDNWNTGDWECTRVVP